MSNQSTAKSIVNQIRKHVSFKSMSIDDLQKFGETITACIEEGGLLSGYAPLDSVVLSKTSSGAAVTGSSVKLRNAWFDLAKLFEVVASGAFTLTSVASLPWLAPFGFLLLYRQFHELIEIELREQDALVLLGLWRCRVENGTASASAAYSLCIQISKQCNLPPISREEFDRSLEVLCSLGCIEAYGEDSWRLVERIQFL